MLHEPHYDYEALRVAEVLLLIFEHLPTAKDLVATSLVCRLWENCSFPVLWRKHLVPFRKLLEILGSLESSPNHINTVATWRWDIAPAIIPERTLERFLNRCHLVTRVDLGSFALDQPSVELLQQTAARDSSTLFQHLQEISVALHDGGSTTLAFLLTSALSCVSLQIVPGRSLWMMQQAGTAQAHSAELIWSRLRQNQPSTLTLSLCGPSYPVFSQFNNLRELSVTCTHATPYNILQAFTTIPMLEKLRFNWTSSYLPPLPEDFTCPFPALRELSICNTTAMGSLLSKIHAPLLRSFEATFLILPSNGLHGTYGHGTFANLETQFPMLQRVRIQCQSSTDTAMLEQYLSLPRIRSLTLELDDREAVWKVPDASWTTIARLTVSLTSLNLMGGVPGTFGTLFTVHALVAISKHAFGLADLSIPIRIDKASGHVPELRKFPALKQLKLTLSEESGDGEIVEEVWPNLAEWIALNTPKLLAFRLTIDLDTREAYEGKDEASLFWAIHRGNWAKNRKPGWKVVPKE